MGSPACSTRSWVKRRSMGVAETECIHVGRGYDEHRAYARSKSPDCGPRGDQPAFGVGCGGGVGGAGGIASRVNLAAIARGDGLALSQVEHPHPIFGPLNLYQWVAFVGAHEARHAAQIREVGAQLAGSSWSVAKDLSCRVEKRSSGAPRSLRIVQSEWGAPQDDRVNGAPPQDDRVNGCPSG